MAGSVSTLGAGSGLDLQGIIDKLKAADQVPITNIKAKQLQYKDQLAEFDTVNTKLLAVKSKALDLSLASTYSVRQIYLSQTGVLSAAVNSVATPGVTEVTVGRLAKQNSWQSSGVSAADSLVASGTGSFTYTINGTQTSVAVSATTTLQQLSDGINSDVNNPGVTATIMDDGTGSATAFHLVLVANDTGDANGVTIDTNNTDLTLTEIQANGTLNAQVTINGMTFNRATNTIADIIPGVTLNLVAPGDVSVTVTSDQTSVKDKIIAMVDAFNEAIKEIATNSAYDQETKTAGSLSGISAFKQMSSQLTQTLLSSVGNLGGAFDNMGDLGLSFNRDGTIAVDETLLADGVENHMADVQLLLVGDEDAGVDGIATLLNAQLRDITQASRGLIANEKNRVDQTIARLNDQIDNQTIRLNNRYDLLTKQFVALDALMSNIKAQGDYLTAQFQSWTGNNNN
jgi:flagellar hook-associated protein 2